MNINWAFRVEFLFHYQLYLQPSRADESVGQSVYAYKK